MSKRSDQVGYSKIAHVMFAAVIGLSCVSVPSLAQSRRAAGTSLSGKEVFDRFAHSVVVVKCLTSDGADVTGSGLIASPQGHVITNAHVLEDATTLEVREARSPIQIDAGLDAVLIGRVPRAKGTEPVVLYVDAGADIAILKTNLKNAPFDLSLAVPPAVGERVYAIGNPNGLENTITDGIVSALRQRRKRFFIQHSAPIFPGSSGGALISERGSLVGMNTFSLGNSENLNFAIPVESLKQL